MLGKRYFLIKKISKSKLGKMISSGTYYISCWMTMAEIKKMQTKKAFFSELDWLTSISFFSQFTTNWYSWNLSCGIVESPFLILLCVVWDCISGCLGGHRKHQLQFLFPSGCRRIDNSLWFSLPDTPFRFSAPKKILKWAFCQRGVTYNSPHDYFIGSSGYPAMLGMRDCRSSVHPCR